MYLKNCLLEPTYLPDMFTRHKIQGLNIPNSPFMDKFMIKRVDSVTSKVPNILKDYEFLDSYHSHVTL